MVLWVIAALIAGFIKGLTGVGDAPVFASIMSFAANNIDISPVSVVPSLLTNITIAVQNRRSLQRRIWLPMALLLVAGMVPGVLLLKNTDTGTLKLVFGFFIIIVGILMMYNELSSRKMKPSRWLLLTVGILAGVTSGLFGIGVLLVIYITLTTEDMSSFKGNICAIYSAENFVRLIMYIVFGLFTKTVLTHIAMIVPFQFAGVFLGMRCASFLDERKAKLTVMGVLIFSGIAIIITQLR